MFRFKEYLVEYITNPLVYFRDYINMSDEEKANDAAYIFFSPESAEEFFNEWEENYDEDVSEPLERPEEVESIEDMSAEQIQLYGEWLMSDGGSRLQHEYGDMEMPSWYYFHDATIVKNTWLIHVSRSVSNIIHEGFRYGVEDVRQLGLTTYINDKYKKQEHNSEFYNFAFTPKAFRYWDREKYGKDFVMFVSSGVEAYHNGDEEDQTLFIARDARYFIPVYNVDGDYTIYDKNDDEKVIYRNEKPLKLVEWVIQNFPQYRRSIVQRERN